MLNAQQQPPVQCVQTSNKQGWTLHALRHVIRSICDSTVSQDIET